MEDGVCEHVRLLAAVCTCACVCEATARQGRVTDARRTARHTARRPAQLIQPHRSVMPSRTPTACAAPAAGIGHHTSYDGPPEPAASQAFLSPHTHTHTHTHTCVCVCVRVLYSTHTRVLGALSHTGGQRHSAPHTRCSSPPAPAAQRAAPRGAPLPPAVSKRETLTPDGMQVSKLMCQGAERMPLRVARRIKAHLKPQLLSCVCASVQHAPMSDHDDSRPNTTHARTLCMSALIRRGEKWTRPRRQVMWGQMHTRAHTHTHRVCACACVYTGVVYTGQQQTPHRCLPQQKKHTLCSPLPVPPPYYHHQECESSAAPSPASDAHAASTQHDSAAVQHPVQYSKTKANRHVTCPNKHCQPASQQASKRSVQGAKGWRPRSHNLHKHAGLRACKRSTAQRSTAQRSTARAVPSRGMWHKNCRRPVPRSSCAAGT
jgi:hypothetical protein